MSNNKYICIHGHFYQPPRENPWLNAVELQNSAYPFHNWNERITAECYARNATARILNDEGKIVDIVNNYSRISFNFGPTLLLWMKTHAEDVYRAILEADKISLERFSGHGSAIAQSFNHIIMPLANKRDKETQVIWGIRDFEYRFQRKPEGMWLSETAVNTDTLEVLAKHSIKFTILSPYQAKSVRQIGKKNWQDVTGAQVDPRQPYLYHLPSGRSISLFFYDGPVSQGIAFERLLNNGKTFASRLMGQLDLDDQENHPQMMHIATDGETYGHHHRFGEMALSYCLEHIDQKEEADITVYGEYLEKFPPRYEVQILENTAWSSTPNLERWAEDGGGNTGGNPEWHQRWRKPLRAAFDWLREEMVTLFTQEMKDMVIDPWAVRNDYIDVILDRDQENVQDFLNRHSFRPLNHQEKIKMLKLLEIQHHAMLMYTSCGWFFDEVTGIETIQDIMYAARAIQLANDLTGVDHESQFMKLLEACPSNVPRYGNAAVAYNQLVRPAIVDMNRVGAHYAVSSLFSDYAKKSMMYSFMVESLHNEYHEAGKYRLTVGKSKLTSEVTWEESIVSYAILHLGEHHLFGGVRNYQDAHAYQQMLNEVLFAFEKSRVHEVVVLMDKHFGTHNYSFWHLFKDEQKRILNQVTEDAMENIEISFRNIYENNYSLMQAMSELNIEAPEALKFCGNFSVNARLSNILESEKIDFRELDSVSDTFHRLNIKADDVGMAFKAEKRINRMMEKLQEQPQNLELMGEVVRLLKAIKKINLNPELWQAQNFAFSIQKTYKNLLELDALSFYEDKHQWSELLRQLFEELNIKIMLEIEPQNS
jgi:alpha-amylase/alpha-mannosidase (GH57 family)